MKQVAAIIILAVLASCNSVTQPDSIADLVLTNGRVVTVDAEHPEAEAVAVMGDTIAAVGTSAEIAAFIGEDTRVIDLDGKLAIPGFIEGHGHFLGLGQAQMILDLTKASSWEDIVAMVAEAVGEADSGEWITFHCPPSEHGPTFPDAIRVR